MSILSFPERGPWGKSSWRGNCSGHVYKEIFKMLKPRTFCDPMAGSFTSIDVAKEMGITAIGLDLHSGFNILSQSILNTVGYESDLVCSHPPYGAAIIYSGNVWGEPHVDDLSRCASDADFHEKMQLALINQREATKCGGVYATIIGDYRKNGRYTSYQAEMLTRMPSDELLGVLIKQQHNTTSAGKVYPGLTLPRILHEYILLWRKKSAPLIVLLGSIANEQATRLRGTWRSIIRSAMISFGGQASLSDLYAKIAMGCSDRVAANPNWKAKVRQILNSTGDYTAVERGIWSLAN